MGDFNVKVGNGADGISEGDRVTSRDGKLLKQYIQQNNLILLNSQNMCTGKWTRVNTKNINERSIIDYALCSQSCLQILNSINIDEEELKNSKAKQNLIITHL